MTGREHLSQLITENTNEDPRWLRILLSISQLMADVDTLKSERDEARNQLSIERELAKQRWLDLAAAESKIDRFRSQLHEWANYGVSSADIRAFLEES